jgi:succinate dehydrogenase / fumarate reductase membrane anchor subunit
MATRTITRRGVPGQVARRLEYYAWLFMRISGAILILMAVFHFVYMHFVIKVDTISFDVIAQRWQNMLWRVYDFVLLALAFTHGTNGARTVLGDYVHGRMRQPVMVILFVLYVVFVLMGAWIIFTFKAA